MKDEKSPCAASALFGIKTITVAGKAVGIARFCDAPATVQSMGLCSDNAIRAALLNEIEKNNYIPGPLRDDYAEVLLAEYRAAVERTGTGSSIK